MSSRGIRNNNPANIRLGSSWRGMTEIQTDKSFCQFKNMVWGVRALISLLRTYVNKYHLRSIEAIIYRWAPPTDGNDTKRYVEFVCDYCASDEDYRPFYLTPIEFTEKGFCDDGDLFHLCQAICIMESGYRLQKDTFTTAFTLL